MGFDKIWSLKLFIKKKIIAMTLVKFKNPVSKTFDNLFDEFFNNFPAQGKDESFGFPPVNIYETKDGYHLEMNVPGRNKEDFKIQVENGLLTISYEKKEENKSEDSKTVRREFSYRNFKRSFSVDDSIQVENIQAKYENGLLKLYLPKKEQEKETTKQISVQ